MLEVAVFASARDLSLDELSTLQKRVSALKLFEGVMTENHDMVNFRSGLAVVELLAFPAAADGDGQLLTSVRSVLLSVDWMRCNKRR
jgi:hypothetical protein